MRLLNRQTKRIYVCIILVGIMLMLPMMAGCNLSEPISVQPDFELPAKFSAAGVTPMPEKWWLSLDDPHLNAVMDQALSGNFTIRAAWDRLTQAEQIAIEAGVALYPLASYYGGAERTRSETGSTTAYTTDYFVGAAASYEVDLWGRIRSARQAAVLDAEAARANVSAAAMTLSATVAKTWYQLVQAKMQVQIITRQIEANQKILEVIKLQFSKGQVGAVDVFNQQQLVQSSRSQLIQAQEDVVLLENLLSVLTGRAPGTRWDETPLELITLDQLPEINVPAVVIQRRPDLVSAYLNVQAADQRLASAIADQYPALTLSASADTSADRIRDLFDDWFANLAANISGPLFDAGLRKAEVQRTRAVVAEQLNNYSQSVLEALQETEDAISQEYHQRQYVESLQKQLDLAQKGYERSYQNYLKGQQDYIRVLTVLVSMQNLEQNELIARRVLIERRIDLCRSIAGGWPLERPEDTELISQSHIDEKES